MKSNIFRKAIALIAVLVLASPLAVHAADEWAKSRKLSIDTTPTGGGVDAAVNQLPMLVRLHSGNFIFADAKPDGSDLRFFAADNKTPLKHYIEKYDATNELGMAWVQVPALTANSKASAVWVRWGNKGASSVDDSKATYDANQILVLNFSDADGVKDATANANNARESSAKLIPVGPIAGAAAFDGNARVVLPASASLKLSPAEGWTFTAWVKPTGTEKGGLFALGAGPTGLSVELMDGIPAVRNGGKTAQASASLKAGIWQHLAVVSAAGKTQFYVNGLPSGEGSLVTGEASGDATVGAGFRGELDAVTLAKTARSPAYLKALAVSQQADSPMLAFADESEATGEINYFAILLGAVTIDGWVVIGILGLMAVVSVWVMVTKTINLSRAEKANAVFLDLFKKKSQTMLDPGHKVVRELESMQTLKFSSIYNLYKVGLDEMAQRFDAQAKAEKPRRLSGAALESIRAALDATIVRANQRFNSGIVLLTIAISGGPFLGLLGTVVGVMITFAAIAAAGDVNVNAIAPGIAAALVATVAGLAVAIPALFAYNWFAIKIKNISADTQVFADEFLTKSAEQYAE